MKRSESSTRKKEAARGRSRERAIALAALAVWLGFVIFVTAHHEPWRDEVRALSTAIGPASTWDLPAALRDDGHPVLWYLVLRWLWLIVRQPYVLKVASVAIAGAACAIFVFRAPFPLWQRVLFLAGVLPLYEYSVVSRNYGIAMALMFVFVAIRRRAGPLGGAIVLALLANTNAPATILTPILALVWLGDEWRRDSDGVRRRWKRWAVAALIVLAGFCASVATAMPDAQSTIVPHDQITVAGSFKAFVNGLADPGRRVDLIPPKNARVAIWVFLLGLLPGVDLAVAGLLGYASVGALFDVAYGGALRHDGIVFMFLVVLYWMAAERSAGRSDRRARTWGVRYVFALVLLSQMLTIIPGRGIGTSFQTAWLDVTKPYSSSKAVAELIERTPDLRDAILVAENEPRLEPFPYYIDNRLYLAREQRFGRTSSFTTIERRAMSLHDLLEIARRLRRTWNVPIVILLRPGLRDGSGVMQGLGTTFTWDASQLAELDSSTSLLGEFRGSISHEDYVVYRLKD